MRSNNAHSNLPGNASLLKLWFHFGCQGLEASKSCISYSTLRESGQGACRSASVASSRVANYRAERRSSPAFPYNVRLL